MLPGASGNSDGFGARELDELQTISCLPRRGRLTLVEMCCCQLGFGTHCLRFALVRLHHWHCATFNMLSRVSMRRLATVRSVAHSVAPAPTTQCRALSTVCVDVVCRCYCLRVHGGSGVSLCV